MRSRGFAFAFLVSILSLVLIGFISTACTMQQKQAAENAINATTRPTQQIADGAAVVASTTPAPVSGVAAMVAAVATVALGVEKLIADYIIPNFPTKATATASAGNSGASGSQTSATSTAPKPQVLPS